MPAAATTALNISTNNGALMVEINPTSLERTQPRSATPKLNASVPTIVPLPLSLFWCRGPL